MDLELKFPPNTLQLPYVCADHRCACHETPLPVGAGNTARPVHRNGLWDMELVDEYGVTRDVLRGLPALNDALKEMHREYPGAAFDPHHAVAQEGEK